MNAHEFDVYAFSKSLKVETPDGLFWIVAVDFEQRLFGVDIGDGPYPLDLRWYRCENCDVIMHPIEERCSKKKGGLKGESKAWEETAEAHLNTIRERDKQIENLKKRIHESSRKKPPTPSTQ